MKIDWLAVVGGVIITSFFIAGVWGGAKIIGETESIPKILFLFALMLMMCREISWGIGLISEPFGKFSQKKGGKK